MKNRLWTIILLIVILLTTLTACQKSASTAPVATPTVTSVFPFPTPLPSSAISSVLASTQTAEALLNPTFPGAISMTPDATQEEASTPTAVASIEVVTETLEVVETTEPTATQVVIPTSTPGKPETYTLQQGEFPFCIARRFDVNPSDLLSLNGLSLDSRPSAGTILRIPQTGSWTNGSRSLLSHPTTYTVEAGDTIYSIACEFGDVDPNNIIAANSLQSPYTLSAGQTLSIP